MNTAQRANRASGHSLGGLRSINSSLASAEDGVVSFGETTPHVACGDAGDYLTFTGASDHAVMTELQITIKLKRETADALKDEARRRGVAFKEFVADILAAVVTDRIYAAVIDP